MNTELICNSLRELINEEIPTTDAEFSLLIFDTCEGECKLIYFGSIQKIETFKQLALHLNFGKSS